MPTGYTASIHDGEPVTGKQFILACARNFGAFIHLRDERMDAELTLPSAPDNSFYEKNLAEAKHQLKMAEAMTVEEAQKMAEESYNGSILHMKKVIADKKVISERYNKVLVEVEAWTPPTDEHQNLKDFAINQLKLSMNSDCGMDYWEEQLKTLKKSTGEEFREERIKYMQREVTYYERSLQERLESHQGKIEWIETLFEAVKEGE
jgi:hypothetical protein